MKIYHPPNVKITLRKLNLTKDISNKYLRWMNDLEVHKYTKQKYTKHSLITIRKFVKENEPGIKMKYDLVCDNCAGVSSVLVPLSSEFFWPS